MSIVSKILYGILGIVLLALALGFAVQTQRLGKAQNQALEALKMAEAYKGSLESLQAATEAQVKSAKAAENAALKRAKVAKIEADKAKKENYDLQEALNANRDWANQPIPSGVRKSLTEAGSN